MNPEASEEFKKKFADCPKTDDFEVWDSMGVPHPFTIGNHLVVWASDRFMGRLGEEAILSYEREKGRNACAHPRCNLSYQEHEQAVAVMCRSLDNDALKQYCESIVPMVEKAGYAGFVFIDGTK